MPWLLGGGALIAILLASKTAAAPTRPLAVAASRRAPARVAPAWRITQPKAFYGWVNYFTGANYTASDPVHPQDYADMIHNACAAATPSDISLLRTLASDLQTVISLPPSVSPHGGIQGMNVSQARNYQNQVLSCIARLQRGGGAVASVRTVRGPSRIAIGFTPNAPAHPSSPPAYVYSPGGGGGGGGGFSPPSMPGGGGGGGAEGTGQPAPTPVDPSTGLPSNVAPPVDTSQQYVDTSGQGTTDSSGATYGGEFG